MRLPSARQSAARYRVRGLKQTPRRLATTPGVARMTALNEIFARGQPKCPQLKRNRCHEG
jgi:hypothetical protein